MTTPVRSSLGVGIERITWAGVTSAGSASIVGDLIAGQAGAIGAVQVTGTFGGATVTLLGSNDGVNYSAITDSAGNAVALAAAGIRDFSTAAAFIRPVAVGGTGDNVTVTVVLRG